MKKFKIPVSWTMVDDIIIEAETLEEAIKGAEDVNLPEGTYCDASFAVNTDLIRDVPECYGEIK